eukprot:6300856-Pyramimonas_sp.AAC.1
MRTKRTGWRPSTVNASASKRLAGSVYRAGSNDSCSSFLGTSMQEPIVSARGAGLQRPEGRSRLLQDLRPVVEA